jgi:3'(2'), 5'-bisphosphate nucleotidase
MSKTFSHTTFSHKDCLELLEAARSLAIEAGNEILEIYEKGFEINRKADLSPVTTADLAAHRIIKRGFVRLTPELPLLSEEDKRLSFAERKSWVSYWLVDPLDGTREFIKRNNEFTVNIALIQQQRPVLGVVYAPVARLCYFACLGAGAYRQHEDAIARRITTRKTPVDCPTVLGSRSHALPLLHAFLEVLGPHELIRRGSSLKSCMVAEGSADIYPRFGPTSEWDTAAAQCVVEEAGGRLTDMNITALRYNTKASLENPPFVVTGDRNYDWSALLGKAR